MDDKEMNKILKLKNLTKYYGSNRVVSDVCLELYEGELLTLLGPSGSGKSTILKIISGFVRPSNGKVLLNEEDITNKEPHKRKIGMFFQKPTLFPHLTVYDNIAFSLRTPEHKTSEYIIKEKIRNILKLIKLKGFEDRYPNQLSGGQEQRVALARAIIFEPPILLLDEPLGALDKKLREHMQYEIKRIQQSLDITVLYVTHDQSEALAISDRIAIINNGEILQKGSPYEIYNNPKHIFVAEFIGESNSLKASILGSERDYLKLLVEHNTVLKVASQVNLSKNIKEVKLVIRPENIHFLKTSGGYDNILNGLIKKKAFLGEVYRFDIEIESDLTIFAVWTASKEFDKLEKGNNIKIGFNANEAVIIL